MTEPQTGRAVNAEESGWTTQTLKVYLDTLIAEHDHRYEQRFVEQEKAVKAAVAATELAVKAAFESSQRAIDKAEAAQKDRNVQQNEIRSQLDDQNKAFIARLVDLLPRREFEAQVQRTSERFEDAKKEIQSLKESRSVAAGEAAATARWWGVAVFVVTVAANIALYAVFHK